MKVRGVIPLLAVAMMASGGAHPAADRHGAVTSAASPASSSLQGVPDDNPRPVLGETGSGQWTTTVLLTDVLPACNYLATSRTVIYPGTSLTLLSLRDDPPTTQDLWDLVAQMKSRILTTPDVAAQVAQVATAAAMTGTSTTASLAVADFAPASSCEVTLTFAQLPQVPETASLVFNDGGASFAIPLTVSRYVSSFDYLAIPAIAGFASVLLFVLLLMLTLRWSRGRPGRWWLFISLSGFREWPVSASSAWTIRDSWATNITSGVLVVGTILASTTATGSLFPGVTLNRFVLVGVIAGGIVLAAPAIFGILHVWLDGRLRFRRMEESDSPEADDTIIASLATLLVTAAVTMFGIGVEIGAAIILVGLSDADFAERIIMTSGIALAAVLLLGYAVTAIGTLASPRRGSVLASPPDTSFTL